MMVRSKMIALGLLGAVVALAALSSVEANPVGDGEDGENGDPFAGGCGSPIPEEDFVFVEQRQKYYSTVGRPGREADMVIGGVEYYEVGDRAARPNVLPTADCPVTD
mmetsp:Transcript_21359/g.50280  ORF Transcript_21359/g.50280 Transcript_21359/m.50280 type:complete len:107 (-) Transcript_21359:35-355(-)